MEIVYKFNDLEDWVIYDIGDSWFFSEEAIGMISDCHQLSLLIGVVVIMEITHGNKTELC